MACEFGFGRFVARDSWSVLLDQYHLARGKVWALIPVWMAIRLAVLRTRQARGCRTRPQRQANDVVPAMFQAHRQGATPPQCRATLDVTFSLQIRHEIAHRASPRVHEGTS